MRNPLLAVALLALAGPAARAQDVPRADLFGGYSYLRSDGESLHGWMGALAWNLTDHIALVGELAGHYGTSEGIDVKDFSYLAGPRFSLRFSGATPFVYAVAGGVRTTGTLNVGAVSISESDTDFGGAAGGGVDFRITDKLAVRAQADYLLIRSGGETSGDPRLSAGIVYWFGRR
jgi:opacity protein-like surface antigen